MDKYVNQLTEVTSAGNDDVIPIQPVGVTGLRYIKKSNLVTNTGGGSGTSIGLGKRNFEAGTSSPPSNQAIRHNAGDTETYISDNDIDGEDWSSLLSEVTVGSWLKIIVDDDNFEQFKVTSVTDNTGYFTIVRTLLKRKGTISGEVSVEVDLKGSSDTYSSLGAFSGSDVTISQKGGYSDLTLSAPLDVTFSENGHIEGTTQLLLVTTPGNLPINFERPAAYRLLLLSGLSTGVELPSGIYQFAFLFEGNTIKISYSDAIEVFADTTPPTLSNFRIEDSNHFRVYFSSSKNITGTTFGGFTIATPAKTITGLTINSGQTTGHYFTVSEEFVEADAPTIEYSGTGSNIQDTATTPNALEAFTEVAITNNISDWVPADLGANLLFWGDDTTIGDAGTGKSNSIGDRSGNFTGTDPSQTTDSLRPTLTAGTQVYDGVDDRLETTDFTQLKNASGCITFKQNITTAGGRFVSFHDSGSNIRYCAVGNINGGAPIISFRIDAATNTITFEGTVSSGDIITYLSTGTAYRCFVNGIERAVDTVSGSNDGKWISNVTNVNTWSVAKLRTVSPVYYALTLENILIHNVTTDQDIVELHTYLSA